VDQFEFRNFAKFGRLSARKKNCSAEMEVKSAGAMFERGRRLMPKQN
jgi:hypothetical protein